MNLRFWEKWKSEKSEAPANRRHKPKSSRGDRMMKRLFSASQNNRLNSDWSSIPETAAAIIQRHQVVLVARSRDQAQDNDHAKAFLRMCHQNIVGPTGVMLQAAVKKIDGSDDAEANTAIEEAWEAWGNQENADVNGTKSWRALQRLAVINAATDGEFMFRIIVGKDAGEFGFALQVIDAQRCPVDYDNFDLPNGAFIRHGIEYNRYRRPIAYYLRDVDESQAMHYQFGGNSYLRIPADEIIHGYLEDMAGQGRGLPWMATSLFRLKNLQGFEDAAILNARIGASKMGFFEWDENYGPEDGGEEAPEIDAEPGTFHELPPGLRLKEFNPQYPSGEFAPFTKQSLRSIAAGMGVTYADLAADLEGVNFSSIRQGTLDIREHWKELQIWLIEKMIRPVFLAWLRAALLGQKITTESGKALPAEKMRRYQKVQWQPRRWQWIDPRADSDAAVVSKNNMMQSPGQIIREQGRDPSTVWAESARDVRAMIDAHVKEGMAEKDATELVMLSMGKPLPPAQPQKQKKETE